MPTYTIALTAKEHRALDDIRRLIGGNDLSSAFRYCLNATVQTIAAGGSRAGLPPTGSSIGLIGDERTTFRRQGMVG